MASPADDTDLGAGAVKRSEAHRIAALLSERAGIAEWLETYDGSAETSQNDDAKFPYAALGDDNHLRRHPDDERVSERSTGWQGNLVIERVRLVAMLKWALERIDEELCGLGVDPPDPS